MKKSYFELVKKIPEHELLRSLYLTQLFLLIMALVLGFFFFDSLGAFLSLFQLTEADILFYGVGGGLVVVIADFIFMRLLPAEWYDDGGINERIFQKRSFGEIAGIAFVVALGEELLFRGVLQTHFGLIVASLLFALVHYRYLFRLFLFINVVGLSFLLGFIYHVTENLVVTIVMHFIIDFLLGCLIKVQFDKQNQTQEGNVDE